MIRPALCSVRAAAHRARRLGAAVLDRLDAAAGVPVRAREDGTATVEFVILFPVFVLIFVSCFESSIMLFRQVMLERGVDIATREIRLDGQSIMGRNELRRDICQAARILPDCEENMVIELQVINPMTFALPSSTQPCINRATSTAPQNVPWVALRASQTMLMRACIVSDPFMPTVGLGTQLVADLDGESIRMVASTAFKVEPP